MGKWENISFYKSSCTRITEKNPIDLVLKGNGKYYFNNPEFSRKNNDSAFW